LLPREDVDAAAVVQRAFVNEGIQLRLGANVVQAETTPTGKCLHYEQDGQRLSLEVDEILVAVGRAANVEHLNLEAAGVVYDKKGVQVNDTLQSTNPNIYAAGDVGLKYQFTHAADASARMVLRNALFPGPKQKVSNLIMPWCTYTDPEVAHVGLYEREAHAQGMATQAFTHSIGEVDRGRTDGETEGFVRVLVRKGSDKILGATIVASHAGEMINEITLAMQTGVGLKQIASVIHPYPTQAEAIKKVADAYVRTGLTPLAKRILNIYMAWRR
jgi:pyruvate/2-oxoglutarate dehydrogenase complex dihydrolipoamide dehydrogenase (E3) component